MRALVLSVALASVAAAQAPAEAPAPLDVWLSAAPGVLVAGAGDAYESLYGTVALQGARGPWTARLSYSETAVFQADVSGLFAMARAAGASAQVTSGDPVQFRTVQLAAGPRWAFDGGTLALIGGPTLTTGGRRGGGRYDAVGVGVSGQAMAQVAGAVWLGAEASAVVNSGASHAGLVGVVRVDLVRAAR